MICTHSHTQKPGHSGVPPPLPQTEKTNAATKVTAPRFIPRHAPGHVLEMGGPSRLSDCRAVLPIVAEQCNPVFCLVSLLPFRQIRQSPSQTHRPTQTRKKNTDRVISSRKWLHGGGARCLSVAVTMCGARMVCSRICSCQPMRPHIFQRTRKCENEYE